MLPAFPTSPAQLPRSSATFRGSERHTAVRSVTFTALPALRAALRDPDEWVALSAAEALGLLGPSADGSNELALADALLHPVVKPARWPFHRDPMRGKWPLVALARLAGQPGFDDLPAHVRSAVDAAFAAASEEGGPDGASSVRLRSGPAWWAALGKQRAAAMGS